MESQPKQILIVSCDMTSHVYASAKLARVYASEGHSVTVAAPEGTALERMKGLLQGHHDVVCVSSGKTATVNQINERPITDPYSYRTLFKVLRNPFPEAAAIAKMITTEHEGMFEPIRNLIRDGNFDIVIPMHSVSAVVSDAVESLAKDVKVMIFSSMPYEPATYLPPSQTWRLTRALSTFPHVTAYSSKPSKNILVRWQHHFWKWIDTQVTQRAWKKAEGIVNACRQKRGLEPISDGYIGYQHKYPSLVVGGVTPFMDESYPVPPQVTVVGAIDGSDDEDVAVEGELKTWLDAAKSGIVYIGFGTGTTLSEGQATKLTGDLYRALQEQAEPPPRVLFALRASQQKRLRAAFNRAFGSQPSSASDQHLEYMNGLFRIQSDLPQAAILNSGQVRVFVSHMGMGGFTEGSQAGVPFVCCPSGCDQYFNMARAIDAGIGVGVRRGFTDLGERVLDVLNDAAMHERSQKIALRLQDFDGNRRAVEALAQQVAVNGKA
ncbi:MAG: glycosyltransferase [Verrucomicrobiota bacterium]